MNEEPSPTSLETAMSEFRTLRADNATLQEQVKTFSELSNKLAAENDALKNTMTADRIYLTELCDDLRRQRDRLQRKLIAIMTRFRMVKEVIERVEVESTDEATLHPAVAEMVHADAGSVTWIDKADQRALEQIVASLPVGAGNPNQ